MSDFNPQHIRRVILDNILTWATIDDIVREVGAARERDGIKPFHCPIQNVQQVVLSLVEQGTMVQKTGDGMPVYKLERRAVIRRRGAVITCLASLSDRTDTQAHVIEKSGCSLADLEDLSAHGIISQRETEVGWVVQLASSALLTVLQRGAEAVVGDKMPPDDDLGSREGRLVTAVDKVTEELEVAKRRLELIEGWARKNNVTDLDAVLSMGDQPAERERVTFQYEEERTVNDAERVLIGKEQASVRLKLASLERQAAPLVAGIKLAKQRMEELVADQCGNTRVISTLAYTTIDWKEGVAITRDYLTERELKREPIPKGTQKPLLPPQPKALAPAPPAALPAAVTAGTTPAPAGPVDLSTAILNAIGAGAGAIHEIIAKVHGEWPAPAELVEKVRRELMALSRHKAIKKGRDGTYVLFVKEQPAPAPDGEQTEEEDDEEPGPLSPPEKRRRGKKAAGGEAHP